MKKVIELLEGAKLDLIKFSRDHSLVGFAMYALSNIEESLYELKTPPRWETPKQWEKRTGKAWPDNAAVYYRYSYDYKTYQEWRVGCHKNIVDSRADFETHNAGAHQIVCATEAGPPPKDWRPEEE